jgi:signal peptidase II
MRAWHWALILLFVGGLVGCDQVTKEVAENELRGNGAMSLVSGVLELTYTQNRDMAFSLLHPLLSPAARYPLLVLAKLLGAGVAFALLVQRRNVASLVERLGLAGVIAGALGNLVDRVGRGYVVDFIHVTHWPVFNVADIAVTVGVGLVLLAWRQPGAPAGRGRSARSSPAAPTGAT